MHWEKTKAEKEDDKLFRRRFGIGAKPKKIKKKPKIDYPKLSYRDYLKTPYWKKVRQAVLKRDDNKCVVCGNTKMLQIHHESYKHVGRELKHLDDLLTLCSKCHKEHHYAQK